ncbi:PREDICTED: RELT-like protein 1 [Nanorana parkeri]|uniref:RELT-like protein 1 n=1 Tax=Nanorana parkeri TaxID=125878 RepID=UPI00085463EA|nr:PREDICTED: RELT-like protein 1 [Nanorana parkeri]
MSPVVKSLVWPQPAPWRVARSADLSPSLDPVVAPSTSDAGDTSSGSGHPEYVAFILVPIFFIMGLTGVLICHILKKKGYRCTTAEAEEGEKISAEKIEMQDEAGDTTNDTVGHIVSYIMRNEANADILKAMVADNSVVGDNSVFDPETPTTPNTPLSPTSPGSPMSTPTKHSCHLHTIGGVADKNVCSRCAQKRWNPFKTPQKSKDPKKTRPSVTVLSVGRFRVTKVEPKSKERKRLMSGTEASKGDVPATPVSVDTRQRSGTETEDQSTVET